jgi:decaprenylphospho-beta-D-erythro-pentofuranosid-2-ulose 2-reductase
MSGGEAGSSGRRVLLLGGTSEIGLAIVGELQAHAPREVLLAGRDQIAMNAAAATLTQAGCPRVTVRELDATDSDRHERAIDECFEELGGVDIAILAVGTLGERGGLPADIPGALAVLETNLVGAGSLLLYTAQRMRRSGAGTLVVLSSVAAERARRSNVVYGASKAGLDALAQGLGDALRDEGVRVLVVRPGFVHTKMTQGLAAAPLSTTPQVVAQVTLHGLNSGAHTVWAPRSLRWAMLALRHLPRPLFRKIKA